MKHKLLVLFGVLGIPGLVFLLGAYNIDDDSILDFLASDVNASISDECMDDSPPMKAIKNQLVAKGYIERQEQVEVTIRKFYNPITGETKKIVVTKNIYRKGPSFKKTPVVMSKPMVITTGDVTIEDIEHGKGKGKK